MINQWPDKRVLLASTNRGKFLELSEGFARVGVTLITPEDLNVSERLPEIEETESSYEGNALKKARAVAAWARVCGFSGNTLADDSGLEVEALGGAPGLYSARFGGQGATAAQNRAALRAALANVPDEARYRARFVCVLALVQHDGTEIAVQGTLQGYIILDERGDGGFGYDPMFLVEESGETLAELKGRGVVVQTHRERAFTALMKHLHLI